VIAVALSIVWVALVVLVLSSLVIERGRQPLSGWMGSANVRVGTLFLGGAASTMVNQGISAWRDHTDAIGLFVSALGILLMIAAFAFSGVVAVKLFRSPHR
jgi:hypothetical protein